MADSWIAYVGHMLFPWGQAASRRVYGNAMSLVNVGHHVGVASGCDQPQEITCLETSAAGGMLAHIGLGVSPGQQETPWQKAMQLLFSASLRTIQWLDAQPTKPSHVILYGGYTPYLLRLIPWCRANNVPLIADIVEWHSPPKISEFFSLSSINVETAMRCLYPRCSGIITISSYLTEYYRRKGCPVVQVPPTIDITKMPPLDLSRSMSGPLTLIYAGNPGNKDLLRPLIDGMRMADPEGKRVRLRVLGPTVKEVQILCCGGQELPGSIQVFGRVSQDEVANILREADFSVLLRPQKRLANAGFPTKFVESLANGVPVIANLTSDLKTYLQDGDNGFICRDCTAEAFSEALSRALCLSDDELRIMRVKAHDHALRFFDYRHFSEPLSALLDKVRLS